MTEQTNLLSLVDTYIEAANLSIVWASSSLSYFEDPQKFTRTACLLFQTRPLTDYFEHICMSKHSKMFLPYDKLPSQREKPHWFPGFGGTDERELPQGSAQ